MWLWWLGNLILVAVVIPAVAWLLYRTLRPALEIGGYADDIRAHTRSAAADVKALEELPRTRDNVSQTSALLQRYARALERIT